MTRNRTGWVLVAGQDGNGATLDHDEFAVRGAGGARAVDNAEQATAAVVQTRALADARDQRLHAVGVTWSDDAAADAALVLESLTDAGFDNVVPVRFPQAAAAPTRDIGPRIGSEQTLEHGAALASAPGGELTDALSAEPPRDRVASHRQPRPLTYAGGVAMLVTGVVGFVVSVSATVGLRLTPDKDPSPVEHVANTSLTSRFEEETAPPGPSRADEPVANRPTYPEPPDDAASATPPGDPPAAELPAEGQSAESSEALPDEAAPDGPVPEDAPDEAAPEALPEAPPAEDAPPDAPPPGDAPPPSP
jgi:hypothetical protein